MKRLALISLFFCCCFALVGKSENKKFHIHGIANPQHNGKVILLIQTGPEDDDFTIKSSIIQNGTFYFEGEVMFEQFCTLSLNSYTTDRNDEIKTDIVLEAGNIYVSFDEKSISHGTPLNNLMKELQEIDRSAQHDLVAFIIRNSGNLIGRKAFTSTFSRYTDEEVNEIVTSADPSFIKDKKVEMSLQSREIIKSIQKEQIVRNNLIGSKVKNFNLQTETGKPVTLYDFLGEANYLILDFWASWCGPCIKSMPKFKELAEKYKHKGIQMLSISLDIEEDKALWLKAIELVDVPWPHVSDLQGVRSDLGKAFGVSDVPYSVILNKEGIILHCIRLPDHYLEPVLEELL